MESVNPLELYEQMRNQCQAKIGYRRIWDHLVVLQILGNEDPDRAGIKDVYRAELNTDHVKVLDILLLNGRYSGIISITCNFYPKRLFKIGGTITGKTYPIKFRRSAVAAIMCTELPPIDYKPGQWRHYDTNGNLVHCGYYDPKTGLREGPFIWYHLNGLVSKYSLYRQNVKIGKCMEYTDTGSLLSITSYEGENPMKRKLPDEVVYQSAKKRRV